MLPKTGRKGSTPAPTATPTPTLDHTAFPHILDTILLHASRPALLCLRGTSRALSARVDAILFPRLSIHYKQGPVVPPSIAQEHEAHAVVMLHDAAKTRELCTWKDPARGYTNIDARVALHDLTYLIPGVVDLHPGEYGGVLAPLLQALRPALVLRCHSAVRIPVVARTVVIVQPQRESQGEVDWSRYSRRKTERVVYFMPAQAASTCKCKLYTHPWDGVTDLVVYFPSTTPMPPSCISILRGRMAEAADRDIKITIVTGGMGAQSQSGREREPGSWWRGILPTATASTKGLRGERRASASACPRLAAMIKTVNGKKAGAVRCVSREEYVAEMGATASWELGRFPDGGM